ncbi:MAG: 3-dehydroquinate synthase [Bacteroidota bacterium]|jgi:3-dehydroquinate synthase
MSVPANIFTGAHVVSALQKYLRTTNYTALFILADENTYKHCYPVVKDILPAHTVIRIKSGEKNKTLDTCAQIWAKLTAANADRKALLLNLGGGVVGDIGGFAAGCYKRGIRFINMPTTLLAMVDASVGAKTGIDFNGFKNQIGLFNDPEAVFIHTGFLQTLPARELRAGFAEVIKHYLIADKKAFNTLHKAVMANSTYNLLQHTDWNALVKKNVAIKAAIVAADKYETGPRKGLNFGHTIGHAVESYYLSQSKKLLHGEAVAIGIICEAYISCVKGCLQRNDYLPILQLIGKVFTGLPHIEPDNIPAIVKLTGNDKKNAGGQNRFTLLNGTGNFSVDNYVEEETVINSLHYYSQLSR